MDVALVMFREDGSRRAIPLQDGPNTIGRTNDCAIRVPLATVSRRHAEVCVEGRNVIVRDLGAANGTFLNNRRIKEEKVKAGDQIVIGPVVFRDADISPVKSKKDGTRSGGPAQVGTSRHVYVSDEDVDPISALEALASSADQTAIEPNEKG
jgi:pSer/pThr/pTyr-binding forkhead associated (FHA) protein